MICVLCSDALPALGPKSDQGAAGREQCCGAEHGELLCLSIEHH